MKNSPNNYQLVIDTTNNYCLLALLDNQKVIQTVMQPTHNNLTELVTQLIHDLLASQQLDYADLSQIYVVIGPGSFTGVKVGVSIVKTICSVYPQIQVFWMDSVSIVAGFDGCGCIDAKSKAYYVIGYENQKITLPLQMVAEDQWAIIKQQFKNVTDFAQLKIETYFERLLTNLNQFHLLTDYHDLLPAYIKPVLYQPPTNNKEAKHDR